MVFCYGSLSWLIIFSTSFNPGLVGGHKLLRERKKKWAHRSNNNWISLILSPVAYHKHASPSTLQLIYLPGILMDISHLLILLAPYHYWCPKGYHIINTVTRANHGNVTTLVQYHVTGLAMTMKPSRWSSHTGLKIIPWTQNNGNRGEGLLACGMER